MNLPSWMLDIAPIDSFFGSTDTFNMSVYLNIVSYILNIEKPQEYEYKPEPFIGWLQENKDNICEYKENFDKLKEHKKIDREQYSVNAVYHQKNEYHTEQILQETYKECKKMYDNMTEKERIASDIETWDDDKMLIEFDMQDSMDNISMSYHECQCTCSDELCNRSILDQLSPNIQQMYLSCITHDCMLELYDNVMNLPNETENTRFDDISRYIDIYTQNDNFSTTVRVILSNNGICKKIAELIIMYAVRHIFQ